MAHNLFNDLEEIAKITSNLPHLTLLDIRSSLKSESISKVLSIYIYINIDVLFYSGNRLENWNLSESSMLYAIQCLCLNQTYPPLELVRQNFMYLREIHAISNHLKDLTPMETWHSLETIDLSSNELIWNEILKLSRLPR